MWCIWPVWYKFILELLWLCRMSEDMDGIDGAKCGHCHWCVINCYEGEFQQMMTWLERLCCCWEQPQWTVWHAWWSPAFCALFQASSGPALPLATHAEPHHCRGPAPRYGHSSHRHFLYCSLLLTAIKKVNLCSKPRLFPHKLLVWPPCGFMLTGGIEGFVMSSEACLFPQKLSTWPPCGTMGGTVWHYAGGIEGTSQFNSRWYSCVCESPYAFHAVSQKFP